VVFSIADYGVADGRKLYPDLILQPGRQRNPDERCGAKAALDGILKFCASSLGIAGRTQSLEHSFSTQVMHE
jgi:hypothetical protein